MVPSRTPIILTPRDVMWASNYQPASARKGTPLNKVRCLFIVARDQPDLWHHLRRDFAEDEEVQVVLDRRRGERRQRVQAHDLERRQTGRRLVSIDRDLRYRSFVILHQQQGVLSG